MVAMITSGDNYIKTDYQTPITNYQQTNYLQMVRKRKSKRKDKKNGKA